MPTKKPKGKTPKGRAAEAARSPLGGNDAGKLGADVHEKIAALLIHGRLVRDEASGQLVTVFPSATDLAAEFGVARSMIGYISKKYDCIGRRVEEEKRVIAMASARITELRADAIAFDKAFQLDTIDEWLHQFRTKLADKKVPVEQPLDYERMVRLRSFVDGGVDGRQELTGGISLEFLVARHAAQRAQILGGAAALPPSDPSAIRIADPAQCAERALSPRGVVNFSTQRDEVVRSATPQVVNFATDPRSTLLQAETSAHAPGGAPCPTSNLGSDRIETGTPPLSARRGSLLEADAPRASPPGYFDAETGMIPPGCKGRPETEPAARLRVGEDAAAIDAVLSEFGVEGSDPDADSVPDDMEDDTWSLVDEAATAEVKPWGSATRTADSAE